MKKNNSELLIGSAVAILAVATVLWLAGPVHPVQAAGDPIVVIVNAANPADNLSVSELKKLFLSDRSKWDTGKSVAPVMVAAGAPERTSFLKIVCGMNDADFGKYFLQAAFTGKSATPPKEVGSAGAVKSFVVSSPGGIGFVKALDFHGDGSDGGVKAVKIDGMTATDAGYKLRM
jgi:ABC-type phosphate transport system substrate-binding protein